MSLEELEDSKKINMEQDLRTYIFKELVNIGYAHSADALSMILFEGVLMQQVDFEGDVSKYRSSNPGTNFILLKTELMGELSGISYLYISEQQAKVVFDKCLPEWDGNNPDSRKEMEKAILMEIDNMLAASVVTKLSNLLGVNLYGGVPEIMVLTDKETDQLFEQQQKEFPGASCYSYFRPLSAQSFQPGFTWFFGDDFKEKVNALAEDDSKRALISGE